MENNNNKSNLGKGIGIGMAIGAFLGAMGMAYLEWKDREKYEAASVDREEYNKRLREAITEKYDIGDRIILNRDYKIKIDVPYKSYRSAKIIKVPGWELCDILTQTKREELNKKRFEKEETQE